MDASVKITILVLFCSRLLHCQKQEIFTTSLFEKADRTEVLKNDMDCPNARLKSVQANHDSLSSVCSNCFQIFTTAKDDHYDLKFVALGNLDYSQVQSYRLTVNCYRDDGNLLSVIVVNVLIEPNTSPSFNTYYSTEIKTMAQLTAGSSISRFCEDNNVATGYDSLTFTLQSMEPVSSAFQLTQDGLIMALADPNKECRSSFKLTITCKDRYNKEAAGKLTINLVISDGNDIPTINGLNYALDVAESTVDGTRLAELTVNEGGSSPICSMSSDNADLRQYFQLTGTGAKKDIAVKGVLNYEASQNTAINLTVTCNDGYCTSPEAYLYVRVIDINEPVRLYPSNSFVTTYEGWISVDPKLTAMDDDENDDITYTIVKGNDDYRFSINTVTGTINSTLQYDVDGAAMPSTEILEIQAADMAGLADTATVTLTILDRNDNRPVFVTNSQTVDTDDCPATIGTTIATVNANDLDSAFEGNNAITYSVVDGLFSVDNAGAISISDFIQSNKKYFVSVTATDAGRVPGPQESSVPATVIVNVKPCATPTAKPPQTPATQPKTAPPAPAVTTVDSTTNVPSTNDNSTSTNNNSNINNNNTNSVGNNGSIDTLAPRRTLPTAPNELSIADENRNWMAMAAVLVVVLVCAAVGLVVWRIVKRIQHRHHPRNNGNDKRGPYKSRSPTLWKDMFQPQPISNGAPPRGYPPLGHKAHLPARYAIEYPNH